ncbi:MAG: C10 family peptidase [Bacteroidota bacterium]
MKKKSLIPLLAAMVLIAAFSCKKEPANNNAAPPKLSAALLTDPNFVAMSVAGVVAANNTQLVSHVNSKSVNSTLTLPAKQVLDSLAGPDASNPSYYVFNYVGGGFAIVSADKRVQPILAYSNDGYFKISGNLNGGLTNWLTVTDKNMRVVKSHRELKAPKATTKMWATLLASKASQANKTNANGLTVQQVVPDNPPCEEHTEVIGVDPLLQTTWNQTYPYNALCPAGSFSNGHTPTGCVATAMAQVMYYWQYPTSYSWSSMPLNAPSYSYYPALAQLMVDAGTAVNMVYNDAGSHPYHDWFNPPTSPADGLTNHLGYSSGINSSYSDGDFPTIMANLNNHWPVIFAGATSAMGHAWVCDGYNEYFFYTCASPTSNPDVYAVLLFHMNWGWGGASNGYYNYNSWNVLNGSTYEYFQYDREMNYNIHP